MAASALAITACSSNANLVCEAEITKSLLNPETAEFFDWSQSTADEFRTGVMNMAWNERNVLPSERWRYGEFEEAIGEQIDTEVMSNLKDASFSKTRVKADSRMGLKVTSHYVCAKTDEGCLCTSSDE